VLDQRLADGAQEDREAGDAELNGSDEPHRAVHDAQRDPCPHAPRLGQLAQAGATGGDERVLGGHEKGIADDDRQHRDQLEEDCHAPAPGGRVLGGRSSTTEF